jgi:hypothetical protein
MRDMVSNVDTSKAQFLCLAAIIHLISQVNTTLTPYSFMLVRKNSIIIIIIIIVIETGL